MSDAPPQGAVSRGAVLLPAPGSVTGKLAPVTLEYVESVRAELAAAFWENPDGLDTTGRMASAIDNLVRFVFESADARYTRRYARTAQHCAIFALGGYGRREQFPRSDVDLLVLHSGGVTPYLETIAELMLYTLWDSGLELGHAVRSLDECVRGAREDLTIRTSLLDGRFVCGSPELAAQYETSVREPLRTNDASGFVEAKCQEAAKRHAKQGGSVFLLEPNIKEGHGGLRDLHAARWIAQVTRGIADLEGLQDQGLLTEREYTELAAAQEFLFRTRVALHFADGKAEQLTFERQEMLAERLHYPGADRVACGEAFLQDYYGHSAILSRTCEDLIERLTVTDDRGGLLGRFARQRGVRQGVAVSGGKLIADESVFHDEPLNLLRVFSDGQRWEVPLSAKTREGVRRAHEGLTDELAATPEAVAAFFEILRGSGGVYEALAAMNRVGVLGRMIPEFGRLFCMVSHDYYHVYTVDEHSLVGVREVERLRSGEFEKESAFITHIMRDCDVPELLFLGMMFHDLGKGCGGDHDERGAFMVRDISRRPAHERG